jgi:hypothetical protein
MANQIRHITVLEALNVGFKIYINGAEDTFAKSMSAAFRTRDALNQCAALKMTDEDLADVINKYLPPEMRE